MFSAERGWSYTQAAFGWGGVGFGIFLKLRLGSKKKSHRGGGEDTYWTNPHQFLKIILGFKRKNIIKGSIG